MPNSPTLTYSVYKSFYISVPHKELFWRKKNIYVTIYSYFNENFVNCNIMVQHAEFCYFNSTSPYKTD